MAELLSRLDLFRLGRTYVKTRATRIDPVQIDVEGSDANLFVGSASFMGAAIVRQLGSRTAALLLDASDGEDLVRWAFDRYRLAIKGASAAVGQVRFFRQTAAAGIGSIPAGTKLVSLTGVEYIMTTEANFGALALEATADVRAAQAGKNYQLGLNQLRRFANISNIFDATIELNNDERMAGGEDREEPDDFRERVRAAFLAQRRGILAAIETGALNVPGVVSAVASEALDSLSRPARVVILYIADSSGVASTVLAAQVRAALLEYRAGGIQVVIVTSLPQIVDVTLKLTFAAGIDTAALTQNVRAAVFEFVNSLPVNGPLYIADLESVLSRYRSSGLIVDQSTVVVPVGDLIPSPGQTLRTRLQNITVL